MSSTVLVHVHVFKYQKAVFVSELDYCWGCTYPPPHHYTHNKHSRFLRNLKVKDDINFQEHLLLHSAINSIHYEYIQNHVTSMLAKGVETFNKQTQQTSSHIQLSLKYI